jgi:DMSO/TMAO reductase YedYZ molybdopterin-dependent catalytic subunit
MATRGFVGRKRSQSSAPVPPGQYVVEDFPVLSAGPTPRTPLEHWSFAIDYDGETLAKWSWEEFLTLPQTTQTVDIHCVTKWSKLGTTWDGVTIDALLEVAAIDPPAEYVMGYCDGDYTTNLPVEDVLDGKGMVALRYEGEPLPPEHGGPARLLVPHLYFWKSAKWIRGLRFMDSDEPGFWEAYGYHMYGDPWREQRYAGD